MKPLVLGGSGFLGSWIIRELISRNIFPSVLSRQTTSFLSSIPCRLINGDCRNYSDLIGAMKTCDTVIHSAGFYPDYSVHKMIQYHTAMAELDTVLAAAKESGIKKFIFISSPTVLTPGNEALEISTYCYIKYHLHKRMQEEISRGFPGVIIIPGGCFGPGDWKVITGRVILEIISRRLRMYCEGTMNIVDVRDVAYCCVEAVDNGKVGSVYQVGNWNCRTSEFMAKVCELGGIPVPKIRIPYLICKSAARFLENVQFYTFGGKPFLPETGFDLVHFASPLDSAQAERDLRLNPIPVEKTLMDSIIWYKKNNYLSESNRINFKKIPEFHLKEKFT